MENRSIKPRVCSCGCGRQLFFKDGSPDYSSRRFATAECRQRDKINRMQADRAKRQRRRDLIIEPIWVTIGGNRVLVPTPRAAIEAMIKHCTIMEVVAIDKKVRRKKAKV